MALRAVNSLLLMKTTTATLTEATRRISCVCGGVLYQNFRAMQETTPNLPINKEKTRTEKLSRAMIAFLERANEYEKTIGEKQTEFDLGKKHLARIMGLDPHQTDLDQSQINKAIEYLMPSSLFEKKARPFLKPPKEYYPQIKELQFDTEGRPRHYLYFTGNPRYYELIDTVANKVLTLDRLLDEFPNVELAGAQDLSLVKYDEKGSKWVTAQELSKRVGEKIDDVDYARFLNVMQRLVNHPFSRREEEFINKHRDVIVRSVITDLERKFEVDPDGRKYASYKAKQRTAQVSLRLYQGSGNVKITSEDGVFDILFFRELKHREQLLFPFKILNAINKYDIEMTTHGGMSCIAKAARYAISKALCNFVDANDIEKLRIAGLLTADPRSKERKKPGQEGARRKFTWKKR